MPAAARAAAGKGRKAKKTRPNLHREKQLGLLGFDRVAGIDEAGMGPLAGPVVAAALILPPDFKCQNLKRLTDSKQLTAALRDCLFDEITQGLEYGIASVDAATIDIINIRQAAWRAMRLAATELCHKRGLPAANLDYVLIDGYGHGAGPWPYDAIVKGDALSLSIAGASVLAKVTRDRMMEQHGELFPEYGFERHKGYACPEHLEALQKHGPCPIHRRSFSPVRTWLETGSWDIAAFIAGETAEVAPPELGPFSPLGGESVLLSEAAAAPGRRSRQTKKVAQHHNAKAEPHLPQI